MGRETVLFKSEESKGRADVAAFLRQLADKVEAGRVTLRQGQQSVELDIPDRVTLEVKAEEEQSGHTKRSLEVEIEWAESGLDESGGSGVELG